MRILVLGTGRVGSAVAWDLVRNSQVKTVGVADVDDSALRRTEQKISSKKLAMHRLDVSDKKAAIAIMQDYDVAVSTLPTRRTSYKAIEAAVDAELHLVDILEEYHRRPDAEETSLELPAGMDRHEYGERLHRLAKQKRVTILDGMGFAPGLSNVTLAQGIRKLDVARRAIARVGGIPSKRDARCRPLGYMITWSFEHCLREYMVDVTIIEQGKRVIVPAMSGYETFRFSEFDVNEELEAFITPGMPSFVHTHPDLEYFAEKTIRWPGHWQEIRTLKECGLLSADPIEYRDIRVVPRDFICTILTPRLRARRGDADICIMYNTVNGIRNGRETQISYYMYDKSDPNNDLSSMARVTGFTAAISATLLGKGRIAQRGIVPPEELAGGDAYQELVTQLGGRGISVKEEVE
jgi:saccharopine dehydrogenase-like NADP-dependent oxidoreductase